MPITLTNLCFTKQKPSSLPHRHHHQPDAPPPPSSTLVRTFNSLFIPSTPTSSSSSSSSTPSTSPDFLAAFSSGRFFFSSPGPSNSILPTPPTLPPNDNHNSSPPVNDGVSAVPTISPDPYADFRRSMQEVVEARGLSDVRSDCEFLHEMLLCYLALNPKNTHKFIVGAFADLLVCLMSTRESRGGRDICR